MDFNDVWSKLDEIVLKYSKKKFKRIITNKLTEQQVSEIKTRLNNGIKNKELSKQYNVRSSTISNIYTEKCWKNIKPHIITRNKIPQYLQKCKLENCNNKAHARGLCASHNIKFLRHGDPNISLRQSNPPTMCKAMGCNNPHRVKGYCQKHYSRKRRVK